MQIHSRGAPESIKAILRLNILWLLCVDGGEAGPASPRAHDQHQPARRAADLRPRTRPVSGLDTMATAHTCDVPRVGVYADPRCALTRRCPVSLSQLMRHHIQVV